MWFKFLGTSAGAPTKTRNVTGLALGVSNGKGWYLVDCGEGTQHRVMQAGLSLCHLKAICITHVHGDHCFGLPGLLASASMMGRTQSLTIIGPASVEQWLNHTLAFSQSHASFSVRFLPHEEMTSWAGLPDFKLGIVPLSHRVPCRGYVFETLPEPPKLDAEKLSALGVPKGPLWGQLKKGEAVMLPSGVVVQPGQVRLPPLPPKKCLIGGDNDRPECFSAAAQGADVLIHEATYTTDVAERIGPGPQHSTAAVVARFAQSAGVPNLVLTHFSPRYRDAPSSVVDGVVSGAVSGVIDGEVNPRCDAALKTKPAYSVLQIQQEAERVYDGRLFLAEDFAHFELNAQKVLTRQK